MLLYTRPLKDRMIATVREIEMEDEQISSDLTGLPWLVPVCDRVQNIMQRPYINSCHIPNKKSPSVILMRFMIIRDRVINCRSFITQLFELF